MRCLTPRVGQTESKGPTRVITDLCVMEPDGASKELNRAGQVVFRYCAPEGDITEDANPNGSLESIAGICNREGNVLGMMPHPERCSEEILGGTDGLAIFQSVVASVARVPTG